MTKPIFLIGPPGVGKSTIGTRLAKHLDWPFHDMDRILEERSGVSISHIFEVEGEEGFRARESKLLEELCQLNQAIISTGGGVVLAPNNRKLMTNRGTVIYLKGSVKLILNRTRYDKSRPLLQGKNREARLKLLMSEREPLYQEAAHIIIPSRQQTVAQASRFVIKRLESFYE